MFERDNNNCCKSEKNVLRRKSSETLRPTSRNVDADRTARNLDGAHGVRSPRKTITIRFRLSRNRRFNFCERERPGLITVTGTVFVHGHCRRSIDTGRPSEIRRWGSFKLPRKTFSPTRPREKRSRKDRGRPFTLHLLVCHRRYGKYRVAFPNETRSLANFDVKTVFFFFPKSAFFGTITITTRSS